MKVQNPRRRGMTHVGWVMCHVRGSPPPRVLHFSAEALVVSLCVHDCATSAQLFQRLLWFLYAVCHVHDCAKSAQLFQRLLLFPYAVCHVHACATSAQLFQRLLSFLYAICHFFAELKIDRMFQLPLYSVDVACLALFSQISLVQSLKFFDVSSLPFWQYTALSFFTER